MQHFYQKAKDQTCMDFRGRPIMIWGGAEEKSKMDLFFPRESLLRIIFEIYFFPGKAS